MATIIKNTDKNGNVISYRIMACVGRDEMTNKQIWRTRTIKRPEGMTPAKEQREIERQADAWEQAQRQDYYQSHSKEDKSKISFADFVEKRWWPDHVMDGSHTPSSISFYKNMADDLVQYFGKKRLSSITGEDVKRYIKYLNTEARISINEYRDIPFDEQRTDSNVSLTWKAEKDALSYQVFRKKANRKKYIRIASTPELTYTVAISPADVNDTYQVKARFSVPGDEPYSATTIVRHYQTLRNILNYALRFDYFREDPCKKLSIRDKPQKSKKKVDFLEPEQARRFMAALEEEPLFWRCCLNILITCGLRRGECVGLQWRDIDPNKLTITISRNVTIDRDAPEKYSIGTTKTGEERTVPVSKRVYDLLMELKTEQEQRLHLTITPDCYIFSRIDDPHKPCYPTEPTRFVAKFVKKHGLPNVSPHDLRHSAASLALEAGANLKEVQQLLGHKDPSTTMEFYAGVTEEAQRRTVEGIESLIGTK